MQLGQAYEQTGSHDLALDALDALARNGRNKEAEEDVLSALEAVAPGRYIPPYAPALIYVGLGDYRAALESAANLISRQGPQHCRLLPLMAGPSAQCCGGGGCVVPWFPLWFPLGLWLPL